MINTSSSDSSSSHPTPGCHGILFADICGSTRLYETLGDQRAQECIARCLEAISAVVQRANGIVVKTIGDEIMCRFGNADDTFHAACIIQETVDTLPVLHGALLRMRVGLHYGPALLENGDVFGDAVNVAARMAGIARAEQIITSAETIAALSPVLCEKTRVFDSTQVKGKQEEMTIHEILWSNVNVTTMMPAITVPAAQTSIARCELILGQDSWTLAAGDSKNSLSLGRAEGNDIIVPAALASRNHARIDYRRGKFVLIDTSTNGTYVRTQDGKNVYLRREELPLWGTGQISLGEAVSDDSPHLLSFRA